MERYILLSHANPVTERPYIVMLQPGSEVVKYEDAQKAIDALQSHVAELIAQLRDGSEELAQSYAEQAALQRQVADLTAKLEAAESLQSQLAAERDELQAKRDTEWAQFVRISRDEQIAGLRTKWINAEYQLDALRELVGALDRITPKRPMEITYDKGVEIVNHVQDVLLPTYRATLDAGKEGGGDGAVLDMEL